MNLAPFDAAWVIAGLTLAVPLLLAGVGELICERTGIFNVGLEGMFLSGAFTSYVVADITQSAAWGLVGGVVGGLFFGVIMGLLTIVANADQIIAGVGINLAAIGLTGYLFDLFSADRPQTLVPLLEAAYFEGLADVPVVGVFFGHDPIFYLAFALVPLSWLLLFRTKWGLAIRSVGEAPEAAEAAGISVRRVKWSGVLAAAGLAGLGGAYLVVVEVGIFQHLMSGGRGFLVLAAVIFGGWKPMGLLAACLALGSADALQLRLATATEVPIVLWWAIAVVALAALGWRLVSTRGWMRPAVMAWPLLVVAAAFVLAFSAPAISLPDQLWRSLPFLVALVVLARGMSKARMPSRLGLEAHR
jgi:ABC-type uncharacterized transport system permease subunit